MLAASPPLTLQVSAEIVPAGGWAQIKISANRPQLIASGRIVMDLDPSVFGAIQSAGLFGANGDAYGFAQISGQHVDATFSSPTAGIGQLASLPILVVSVPVLASAPLGKTIAITVDASRSQWTDAQGSNYSVSVTAGSVTIGGGLFVKSVLPGTGLLPAGTVVKILGGGFSPSTTVTMDSVAIASNRFIGPGEIDLTLASPAELTGKRVNIQNPDSSSIAFYSFQMADPSPAPSDIYSNTQPLFPVDAWTTESLSGRSFSDGIAIQNPTLAPVDVMLRTDHYPSYAPQIKKTVTLAPGSWSIYEGLTFANGTTSVTSVSPVRIVHFYPCGNPPLPPQPMPLCTAAVTPVQVTTMPQSVAVPSSLTWHWAAGSSLPSPRAIQIVGAVPFSSGIAFVVTVSDAPWLKATPLQSLGTDPLTITANPAGLGAGSYQGTITVTPVYGQPILIPVSLIVGSSPPPTLTADPSSLAFNMQYEGSLPPAQTISLSSSGVPEKFAVTVSLGLSSLMHVTASSDTTPATLTISADPSGLLFVNVQPGLAGTITISGPGNDVQIPVQFRWTGLLANPTSLTFSAQTGAAAQTQIVYIYPAFGPFSISIQTDSGGASWLSAQFGGIPGGGSNLAAFITANPAELMPGNYTGTVTIKLPGTGSVQVPVQLAVWSSPPLLQTTPQTIRLVQQYGGFPPFQNVEVDSGGVPVALTVNASSDSNWLVAVNPNSALTPTQLSVSTTNTFEYLPGEYHGAVTITGPGGPVTIPVLLLVTTGPATPSMLASVTNAASQTEGPIAPGEIITLRGFGVGSSEVAGFQLDSTGRVATTANGAQVLINGKPSPILYSSANQTNVIVPYEVQSQSSSTIEIVNGTTSASWGVPVAAASPAIFTLDSSGLGPAAVLNQDNSINGPQNPAARGSAIQIFATGEGLTSPPGVTGSVTQTDVKFPVSPVQVTIGGMNASVLYAGSAPHAVAGLFQVNAVIPQGTAPGLAVPISITVGGIRSQDGVTISIR